MNLSKNFKSGFTLIELLVVVAIIGILASVVLASLNAARDKGKNAAAQSSISSMRAQAELGLDKSGTYLEDLCNVPGTTPGGLKTLYDAAVTSGATLPRCATDAVDDLTRATAWGVMVTLPTGTLFCADSTGFSGSNNVIVDDIGSVGGADVEYGQTNTACNGDTAL